MTDRGNRRGGPQGAVLIVDDEPLILSSCRMIFRSAGLADVHTLSDPREVMPLLARQDVDVVVLDLSMPYVSGPELLVDIHAEYPHLPLIVMTATNDVNSAVECMRRGAHDYLVKPVTRERLLAVVKKALDLAAIRKEVAALSRRLLDDRLDREDMFSPIITRSRKMRAIFRYVAAIAEAPGAVLITGETGVGKELIARAVHGLSRRSGPMVAVNVAGLDDALFSDTLFGHVAGAFTGADTGREGLVAAAAGGTLFLDEIGDLENPSQIKLLRLIQEQEYYPVGSDLIRRSDIRVIAATNRDIREMARREEFRRDLYYRLYTHHVEVPPLRERREDIPLLFEHFFRRAVRASGLERRGYSQELVAELEGYSFPGNVRELEALVEDAVIRSGSGILGDSAVPSRPGPGRGEKRAAPRGGDEAPVLPAGEGAPLPTLAELRERLITEAMRRGGGSQAAAASLLGISRQALNRRLNRKRSEPSR